MLSQKLVAIIAFALLYEESYIHFLSAQRERFYILTAKISFNIYIYTQIRLVCSCRFQLGDRFNIIVPNRTSIKVSHHSNTRYFICHKR